MGERFAVHLERGSRAILARLRVAQTPEAVHAVMLWLTLALGLAVGLMLSGAQMLATGGLA